MALARRIVLFVAVNLLVVVTVSFLINALGVRPYLRANGVDHQSLLVFCTLFGFVGSFISLQMSRWSAKHALGVQLLDPEDPGSAGAGRLVDTVRRQCQRAGLEALPEIGVYDSPEVNAFATGPSASRSLVAVSTGLLRHMDEEAVEGVIGHEIAHVANGDMVTMALIQGVANAFVMFFARLGAFAIDSFLRRSDDEGPGLGYFAHYLLVSLLETVFMLLATPVVCAFSRWREFRADAGSARASGRETMIHALESLRRSKPLEDDRAPALASFKINGHGRGLLSLLFASHPPLEARIEALKRLP